MDIREKMHSGDLYLSGDEDLVAEQLTFVEKLYDFNATRPFQKYSTTISKLKSNPSDVYKYIYSKILFDDGKLNKIINEANSIYNNYKTPTKEFDSIKYWLSSTKSKLLSSIKNGNAKQVSYLISTNTWKLLVWYFNYCKFFFINFEFNLHIPVTHTVNSFAVVLIWRAGVVL